MLLPDQAQSDHIRADFGLSFSWWANEPEIAVAVSRWREELDAFGIHRHGNNAPIGQVRRALNYSHLTRGHVEPKLPLSTAERFDSTESQHVAAPQADQTPPVEPSRDLGRLLSLPR